MSRQSTTLAGAQTICSHEHIAAQRGVTRERARQIEVSVLRKARIILNQRGIEPAMFLDVWRKSADPA
jgi:DNA-directed RNA polymerase sigma subunit (sigma70/sigma32)